LLKRSPYAANSIMLPGRQMSRLRIGMVFVKQHQKYYTEANQVGGLKNRWRRANDDRQRRFRL
jgi:hypothetical protein